MRASSSSAASTRSRSISSSSSRGRISRDLSSSSAAIRTRNSVAASRSSSPALSRCDTYARTTSARSTSSRSTSSLSTSVSSRSKGPWKTSRSRSSESTAIGDRLRGRPDAHAVAGCGDVLMGDRVRLFGPGVQDRMELLLVGAQLLVALAHRREVIHHGLRYGLLELPVARTVEFALDLAGLQAADHREDVDQIRDARLVWRAHHVGSGVRHGAFDLLLDRLRVVEHAHHARVALRRGRHLLVRLLQVHDPRAHLWDARLRNHERLAEARVEALCDVAGELEMLALVIAHRHLVGVVSQDVRRLEDRVGEQPRGHELALLGGLLL